MYKVELPTGIKKIMDCFYKVGLWHSGDEITPRETTIKLFYSFFYSLFLISLIVGAFSSDDTDESIFLVETAVLVLVAFVKILYMIWKQREFVDLLIRIGEHFIDDREQFNLVNEEMESFMKLSIVLVSSTLFGAFCAAVLIPLLGSERQQFLNVGFPFDWRTNELVYWSEFVFLLTEIILSISTFLFSVLMWYLLLNCALKYDVLANRLRKMDVTESAYISDRQKDNLFLRDLIGGINSHRDINEYFR